MQHDQSLKKDKVIKKQKPLPPIEKEEEPFEIPSSWEWVRLGDVGIIKSGGTPKTKVVQYWENGDIPWITPADMGKQTSQKFLTLFSKHITSLGLEKSSAQLIEKNSIIYSSRAPIGHINIVPFTYTTNQGCKSITPLIVNFNFLYYILQSLKEEIVRQGSGTTFKEISLTTFSNIKLPLPPLSEQQRIVSKIEELFAELDKIDEAQETYDNAANKLREKVLDTAMRGKLVPQDPNDEPASELLKRIEDEKQRLIKEKVIKKQKALPPIEKDEEPFKIPTSWEWVRLGEISYIVMGQSPKGEYINNDSNGVEFHQGKTYFGNKYVQYSYKFTMNGKKFADKDSILMSMRAPVGDVNLTNRELCIGRGLAMIKPFGNLLYVYNYLLTQKSLLIKQATGSTFKAITSDKVNNLLISLPPLSEQQRIVSKIEEILPLLEG